MTPAWLPQSGSLLLRGAPGSFQSFLAFDAAMAVAARGGVVAVLASGAGPVAAVPQRILEWRSARQVPIGHRLRVHAVDTKHLSTHDLLDEISRISPDIVLRDKSQDLGGWDRDGWLREARAICGQGDRVVLTAMADTVHTPADVTLADVVWAASPFRFDQHSMNARLTRERPLPARVLEYVGRQSGRQVLFDPLLAEAMA